MKITVFCGAKSGHNPRFTDAAVRVGKYLANMGMELIYGGSADGLMGAVATSVLGAGGKVTGVLPKLFLEHEIQHSGLTTVLWTETMGQRKDLLLSMADVVLVLPGGLGTLDELFEVLTLNGLKVMNKPVLILNLEDYFSPLLNWLETIAIQGFASVPGEQFVILRSVDELEIFLK